MALMWHLGQMLAFKGCLMALTLTTISFWTQIWTQVPSPSLAKT
jgi:hypothetical protein